MPDTAAKYQIEHNDPYKKGPINIQLTISQEAIVYGFNETFSLMGSFKFEKKLKNKHTIRFIDSYC